ncbi:iron-sulfur cluster repair protein YtfE (RIC family) [Sinorhizobium terangae]|nr:hemerythrin domain-containing protein [Sinorhizobium terangae]MBB4186463.1 iron-sulfur cluster repair protein YtfE (RIC family) [Sinorhizobium terangae]
MAGKETMQPSRMLENGYDALLELCDRLEAIADTLPNAIDVTRYDEIANTLVPTLGNLHELEEQVLFRQLRSQPDGRNVTTLIERLRKEHEHDEKAAAEVADALRELLHGRCRLSWDAIGYMLRVLFENLRRHVATERLLLAERRRGACNA